MSTGPTRDDVAREDVEPHVVVAELVGGIDPGLDAHVVVETMRRVIRAKPAAVRLARLLIADPALLTSGRPVGPAALERLIHALQEAGAAGLVRPACARCGKHRPLTCTNSNGLRICKSCTPRRAKGSWVCAGCGRSGGVYLGLDGAGRELCKPCFDRDRPADPVTAVREHLAAVAPGPTDAVLRDLVAEATEGNPVIARRLLWDLQAEPGLLAGRVPHRSNRTELVARLLYGAGAASVAHPVCPRCARAVRLPATVDRVRVCGNCRNQAKARPCADCGTVRPVAGRDRTGAPLCDNCRGRRPDHRDRCRDCGEPGHVSIRTTQGPVCRNCVRPPTTTCGVCGKWRPCRFADTAEPRCIPCTKRREPCTDCGRTAAVNARPADGPLCSGCWRRRPEAHRPCARCGTVGRPFRRGLCDRCACDDHLAGLLTPAVDRPQLAAVVAALRDRNTSRHPLRWFLYPNPAARFVADLAAGTAEPTHAELDRRTTDQAATLSLGFLRAVLVADGVLPNRDEHLARLERWTAGRLAGIADPDHRRLVAAFARWHVLAGVRRRARDRHVSHAAALSARAHLRAAIAFLAWIADRDTDLADCRQPLVDLWLTSHEPSTGHRAGQFVAWAVRTGNATAITIPQQRPATVQPTMDPDHRWAAARRLLHDDTVPTRDRVAGLLLLLYGQTPARIARLTLDHLTHDGTGGTLLRLGTTPLRLPPPLDRLLLAQADHARAAGTTWLFPTQRPGRALTATTLAQRLRALGIPAEAGRCAALLDLAAQTPVAVLQRLLGISTAAAQRWASGAFRNRYAADVARRR